MEYETLTNGFKDKIKKGDIVKVVQLKNGVAMIENETRIDYVMQDDLRKVAND